MTMSYIYYSEVAFIVNKTNTYKVVELILCDIAISSRSGDDGLQKPVRLGLGQWLGYEPLYLRSISAQSQL